jgi:hypothetical protein
MLLFGRLDLFTDDTARIVAVLVAVLQLFAIGDLVARVAPVAVVALAVLLGH